MRYSSPWAVVGLVAILALDACGAADAPLRSHGAAKGDDDLFDFGETLVTQAMDGELVEVAVDPVFGRTVTVELPVVAGGWQCTSCDAQSAVQVAQTSADQNTQSTVFQLDASHAGVDHLVTFESGDPQSGQQFFSFTLAVGQAQQRSDAFIAKIAAALDAEGRVAEACGEIIDGAPDALALLSQFVPDEMIPAVADACQQLQATGRTPPPGCSGVKPPDRGPFAGKIALTFDDGPLPGSTDKVLQVLDDKGVPATFFINGKAAGGPAARNLLIETIQQGHLLANHTQSHVDSAKHSASSFGASQVLPTDAVLQQAYAAAGQPVPPIKFFRFPYGSTNCTINDIVQDAGYQIVGWHIDTADWCFNSGAGGHGYCATSTFKWVPDQYRGDFPGYALSQARSHGGGILLMHDVHRFTRENLGALIDTLRGAGFEFVRLDDALAFPKLNDGIGVGDSSAVQPPVIDRALAYTGDACANKAGQAGTDRQGLPWQDYSGHQCVDKYSPHFDAGHECTGKLEAGYCPGAANILCCVK